MQEPRFTARQPQRSSRAIRIALLLLATAALSWYSRQKQNNPFSRHASFQVITANQATFLRIPLKNDSTATELLIVLGYHPYTSQYQPLPCPHPWTLISFAPDSGLSRLFATPPAQWFHLDPSPPPLPQQDSGAWPSAQIVTSLQLDKDLLIQCHPQGNVISGSLRGISFLYSVKTPLNCTPGLKSALLENIDIVFTTGPLATIEQIRSCVRPYHLFVLPPWTADSSSTSSSNIHALSPAPCGYAIIDKGTTGVSLKRMKFEKGQSRRL